MFKYYAHYFTQLRKNQNVKINLGLTSPSQNAQNACWILFTIGQNKSAVIFICNTGSSRTCSFIPRL